LFGIFLENLREKLDLLRTQSAELENSADKVALLERCDESIMALHSAANYMGYNELTQIYNNWHEDIVAVQEALAKNEDIPYDFMDGYLSEIYSLFPQLEQKNKTAAPVKVADNTETVSAKSEKTDEERLFDKLNNALDDAGSSSEEAEYELLHGVFEEMISERDDIPADKQASNKPVAKDTAAKPAAKAKKAASKPVKKEAVKQDKQVKSTATKGTAADTKAKTGAVIKKSVRVEAEKIDMLINQVGELVVDRAYFHQLFDDMRDLQQHLKDDVGLDQKDMKPIRAFTYRMGEAIASLGRTSNDLQEGVMKVRMLPISQLFNRYPRLVHDLTRNNNKKVNLRVEGEDTELDKMVVEKLSDPLVHVIRNAIDHGIEMGEERLAAGKPETGTLFLKSYHESNQVVVEVTDDGRGIDPTLVKAKAVEKGLLSKTEADRMLPHEIIRLITTAGFSTADKITDTSGRGVGMDVVRKNIEKLNGTLDIDSVAGRGTTIRLKIPLTLAIIPAHLVRVSDNMYTIPLANIEETLRISADDTTIIEGTEVIYLRNKTLPVIHLSKLFSTVRKVTENDSFFVVVVNTGTQKIGLVVDELLGQEEVVIKPLVDYLRDKSGFSGATIIGDGSISLILDIYEIVKMTSDQQIRRQHELTRARKSGDTGQASQVTV
ncbi:MAG: chemotaxis protein CheA, partial [Gammaproteobacteria bacterium]|nr:chemotaxis protein CheA [Gammaproteobacteria bacterium]